MSASGDASLRLVYGDHVQPVNTALVPNYADIFAEPEEPAVEHRRRRQLRHPARPRRQPPAVPHRRVHARRPTSWSDMFDPDSPLKGKVTPYDDADLHRRRRRLPDGHPARAGDHRTRTRSTRPSSTPPSRCSRSRSRWSASTGRTTPSTSRRQGRRHRPVGSARAGSSPRTSPTADGTPVATREAEGGRDRLVGHLDGREGHQEHQLLVPVARPHRLARGATRRSPSTSVRRPANKKSCALTHEQGPLRDVPRRRETDYWSDVYYWTTPSTEVPRRSHGREVRALRRVGRRRGASLRNS